MGSVLRNAILAFLESDAGGTIADLRRFLIEPAFQHRFLETVRDPDIVYYWKQAFPQLGGNKSIGSVLTRLETFLAPKPIRYMVSQQENRVDFSQVLDSGKILLARLPRGEMGEEDSFLLGSFFVAKFAAGLGAGKLPDGLEIFSTNCAGPWCVQGEINCKELSNWIVEHRFWHFFLEFGLHNEFLTGVWLDFDDGSASRFQVIWIHQSPMQKRVAAHVADSFQIRPF